MQKNGLAQATARKTVSVLRHMFKHAVKSQHLIVNPFQDEELPVSVDSCDKFYVDMKFDEPCSSNPAIGRMASNRDPGTCRRTARAVRSTVDEVGPGRLGTLFDDSLRTENEVMTNHAVVRRCASGDGKFSGSHERRCVHPEVTA